MGLDMYAYSAVNETQYDEYWENYGNEQSTVSEPKNLAYWRKHPSLHGWMRQLWVSKDHLSSVDTTFNGVQLELTWDDLDKLEDDVKNKRLPETQGFFFGNDSSEYFYQQDLNFIKNARADLFMGLRVFYNSSW